MYRRIVVPVDGTAFSESAIPFAANIAHRTGARIELVRVHVPDPPGDDLYALTPYRYEGVTSYYRELDREGLRREWDELASRADALAEATGLEVLARLTRGRIDEAVEHEAEAFHADLIVMATHARTGMARARLGSVADAVVRQATMPVLLVHPQDDAVDVEPAFDSLLVTLDGSGFSSQVLPHATALARLYQAEVALAHVEMARGFWTPAGTATPGQLPATGADYLRQVVIDNGGFPRVPRLEAIVAHNAAAAILDAAERLGSSLIAMATHGRGGFTRLVMGSTASTVLARTTLPVLLLRPDPGTPVSLPTNHAHHAGML